MRTAEQILTDLATEGEGTRALQAKARQHRRRLAALMFEAREHPDVSMELARQAHQPAIARQTAYELAREGEPDTATDS